MQLLLFCNGSGEPLKYSQFIKYGAKIEEDIHMIFNERDVSSSCVLSYTHILPF